MPSSRASDETDRNSWESRSISCRRNAIRLLVEQQAHQQDVLDAAVDDASLPVDAFANESVPLVQSDGVGVGTEDLEVDARQPRLASATHGRVEELPPDPPAAKV